MKLYKDSFLEKIYSGTLSFHDSNLIPIHQFAESLLNIIDAKDSYTANHSEEVAEISYVIALSYGLSENEANKIHIAGHLHDIGKILIPDQILTKKGKLTEQEWKIIKTHPLVGAEILKPVTLLNEIKEMVLYHHERFDGRGYPAGIKAREIPIGARIIAVADSLSAMLKDRVYRKALDFDQALHEINLNSGSQFDPKVVDVLFNIRDLIYKIKKQKGGRYDE